MENLSLDEIGWFFVQEYYTFLNREPERLHCFYTKKSTFIHGNEGENIKSYSGQQEIHRKILELGFSDCKVLVSNVDSQASANGGIVIQVLGEISNRNGPSRRFSQTFFLAEQPNGYFVLNDIFRYLKEDIDDGELCNGECHSHPLDLRNDELSSHVEMGDNIQMLPGENYVTINAPMLLHDNNVNLQFSQHCKTSEQEKKPIFVPVVSVANGHPEMSSDKPLILPPGKISLDEHTPEATRNANFSVLQSQPTVFQSSTIPAPKTWANLFDKTPVPPNKNIPYVIKPTAVMPQPSLPVERLPVNSISVFVKNVKDRISEIDLKHALSRFGTICHIEIKRDKNNALIFYETAAAAASAVAASSMKIGQDIIFIEERRNSRERSRNVKGERFVGGREYTKYEEKKTGNDRRTYVNKNRGNHRK